jgi:hypothetical protein
MFGWRQPWPSQRIGIYKARLPFWRLSQSLTDLGDNPSGRARDYYLDYGGRLYDSKAILGVAFGHEFPSEGPLTRREFAGGEGHAVEKLRQLGFAVLSLRAPDDKPTPLAVIWDVMQKHLPRDEWIRIQHIYPIIEGNIVLRRGDYGRAAPGADEPKWKRNVRNVLQSRKKNGDILWDPDNEAYLIASEGLDVLVDDTEAIENELARKKPNKLSPEELKRLQKSREATGLKGEDWVEDCERRLLIEAGFPELAKRVRRVSAEDAAAGFDILSFSLDSTEKYIEVKSTSLAAGQFFISANELATAKRLGTQYWIYVVSEVNGTAPQLMTIQDPHQEITKTLHLTALTFRVRIGSRK